MLRISLIFALIAGFCLAFVDIEVITRSPWHEIGRMAKGAATPDLSVLYEFKSAILNTLTFAFCGTFLGVIAGGGFAFFFRIKPVRLFCAFIRSIHEIFWAFMLLPIVGLNPVCGVLAIAIPYAGIFAKVYSEILEEADQRPLRGLPVGARSLSRFLYGILPAIYPDLRNYTSYRFECALRSAAVLGFIGLPTIGFHLETAFREGLYSEAAALLIFFYLLVASLKYWLKPKWVLLYLAASLTLISKTVSFSWQNLSRFSYEILPWPMRRSGALNGTGNIELPFAQVWDWCKNIISTELFDGFWQTMILTQIVLFTTGIFTLFTFATLSRHFAGSFVTGMSKWFMIVLRTTPEYIFAYIFVQLWGPSMLPAIVAISLHNGAILSHLSAQNADLIKLRIDAPVKRLNRYFFEILPRVYGQFLAFLFYRWEVMMRESAILGILGIATLGFYIDSAISDDKLDKAFLLIMATASLNMVVDTVSQRVRKKLRVSTSLKRKD